MTALDNPLNQSELDDVLAVLRALHARIRERVLEACAASAPEVLAQVDSDQAGDTIYRIDRVSEHELVEFLEAQAGSIGGLVLIAEGIAGGKRVLPRDCSETAARYRLIVDPIDGTRGLMYQ